MESRDWSSDVCSSDLFPSHDNAATRALTTYPGRIRASGINYRSYLNPRSGGFIGQELKYVDYEYGPSAIQSNLIDGEADPLTALCLNAIAQGDGNTQRDGRRVVMHSVHVKGRIHFANVNVSTPSSPMCRLMLVLDTQTNGAQLSADNVLQNTTTTLETLAWRNLQYSQRFRVLWDRMYKLEPRGLAFINAANQYTTLASAKFMINKKLALVTNYSGTAATIATITDNSLHIICYADDDLGATGSLAYSSRVRFTD